MLYLLAAISLLFAVMPSVLMADGRSTETDGEAAMIARRASRLAMLPPVAAPPDDVLAGANPVDRFLLAAIRAAGSHAGPSDGLRAVGTWVPSSDETFVRRVYLDLIGVIPTVAQAEAFVADPSPDKRARLIDSLLARANDYADHWTPFWEDALASAPAPSTGGMTSRGNSTAFINTAFAQNRPFDIFAAQLIDPSLAGHYKPQQGSDNGRPLRAHTVLNATPNDQLTTAALFGQVFLGTAMKCASCHNHFENSEWPQDRFFSFAAFFGPGQLELVRCEQPLGKAVEPAFPFPIPGVPGDVPTDENQRLSRVAHLMTDPLNPRFAGSIVNRLVRRYLGLGLVEPADDWREQWPPSHPDLLAWLADDFVRSGYDLQHTIRIILNSRAYQAAYDPALEDTLSAEHPEPRLYRSPALRRLTAEQLIDSVRVCTHQELQPARRLFRRHESTGLSMALGKPSVRNEVSTSRSDATSIVQGLELLNGSEIAAMIAGTPLLRRAHSLPPSEAASLLYRAALSRPPTTAESAAVTEFLGSSPTETDLADALWAIITLPEFQTIK